MSTPEITLSLDFERPHIESLGEILPGVRSIAARAADIYSDKSVRGTLLAAAALTSDSIDDRFMRSEIRNYGLLTDWIKNQSRDGSPVNGIEIRAVLAERMARFEASQLGFGEFDIYKAGIVAYQQSKPQRPLR